MQGLARVGLTRLDRWRNHDGPVHRSRTTAPDASPQRGGGQAHVDTRSKRKCLDRTCDDQRAMSQTCDGGVRRFSVLARAPRRHRATASRCASPSPADQARLIATATNEAPSTRVAVATMVATTRVQAKICDCSNVTRLTTRAKRRVRMNNNSLTAHGTTRLEQLLDI